MSKVLFHLPPTEDGLEVLRHVKNNPSTKAVPVVTLTCSKLEEDMVVDTTLASRATSRSIHFDQFRAIIEQLGYYWLVVNQPPPGLAFA